MAELTPKHSRRGLEVANRVAAEAMKAPDEIGKRTILEAVDKLRKQYGFSDRDKIRLIEQSLLDGCHTYDDIVLDKLLHKSQVISLVKSMVDAGDVELSPLRNGPPGRPSTYIALTSQARARLIK